MVNPDSEQPCRTPAGQSPPKDDIGEAATLPASLESVGMPALPAPKIGELAGLANRDRLFEALFQVPAKPQQLGRYVVLNKLGQGGMGVVLEAFDRTLDRRVAVKLLHKELDERHTARLLREAQAMAKLSHPNVVQVFEAGEVDGQTFVAMELVEGTTLRDWIRQDPKSFKKGEKDPRYVPLGTDRETMPDLRVKNLDGDITVHGGGNQKDRSYSLLMTEDTSGGDCYQVLDPLRKDRRVLQKTAAYFRLKQGG